MMRLSSCTRPSPLAFLRNDPEDILDRAESERDLDDAEVPAIVAALDLLECGVLIVDRGAQLRFANRSGRELLGSESGLRLRQGVLKAGSVGETAALHGLVAASAARGAGGMLRLARGVAAPLVVAVAPHGPAQRHAIRARVILLIADPRQAGSIAPEEVKERFGLTASEAAVACEIANGVPIKECARRLAIFPNTAKTHLQRVFEKTGTRRQAELVRLLYTSRPPLRTASSGDADDR